jgi:cellulose biosynthesis protein BcsQ
MSERSTRPGSTRGSNEPATGGSPRGAVLAPERGTSHAGRRPSAERPNPAGPARARIIIGIHDLPFHQEVLDFLGRDPRIEVAATASEPERFLALFRPALADAAVVCPTIGASIAHLSSSERSVPLFVVAEEMTVPVLRSAIEIGAHGAYCWPEERSELATTLPRRSGTGRLAGGTRGRVVAVYGARGGAGTTFVATHLAAALAARGLRTVLVDIDASFSDLTAALGGGIGQDVRSIADLVPVIEELSPDHLEQALVRHERGFDVLLGPAVARTTAEPGSPASAGPQEVLIPIGLYPASVALLAGSHRAVVLHVARTMDTLTRAAIDMADHVVLVIGQDLLSLYGAKRAMSGLRLGRKPDRCHVVVNRARRSEVSSHDVERVLGLRPAASIRSDPAVVTAQDRGELLGRSSRRAARDVAGLVQLLGFAAPDAVAEGPRG